VFGTEKKLEWCGYPTVKKFEDMFSFYHFISKTKQDMAIFTMEDEYRTRSVEWCLFQ